MNTEYKQKNNLPDLYNILGLTIDVCNQSNCNELIQKAYVKKAKVCHPDKHPGRKDIEEIFELITSAYDILKDEKQRELYNHKLSLNKQCCNDFSKLKKNATDYMESLGDYKPVTQQQIEEFQKQMLEHNIRHNYDTTLLNKEAIPLQDAKKIMSNMAKNREIQYEDLKPEKLFDDGVFDSKKFNAMFDKINKREDNNLTLYNGIPAAWNDTTSPANYSTYDNLDNLYVDNDSTYNPSGTYYGRLDFGSTIHKITKEDMQNITGKEADYVDNHNVIGEDYYKDMKTKLRERQATSNVFENLKYNDFKRDDTAGYGIFDKLGYKFDDRLCLDIDEEDISTKFDRLMAERHSGKIN